MDARLTAGDVPVVMVGCMQMIGVHEGESSLRELLHDLRNHLQRVRLKAAGIAAATEKDRARLVSIDASVRDMNDLLEHVREAARVDLAVAPRRDRVDVGAVVERAAGQLGRLAPPVLELAPGAAFVTGDAERLQYAIAQLLKVVIRLTPAGRAVRVGGQVGAAEVIVRVEGAGPDAAPPAIELALFLARRSLEQQGGRFFLEQDAERLVIGFGLPAAPEA